MKRVEGNIVDIYSRQIYPGEILIEDGKIREFIKNDQHYDHYIAPGFVDSHVHIESSMLRPKEFSRLAIQKGTVAVVSDPHEIANVLGVLGIHFMQEDSERASIKIFFTIPSCVPATSFDISGSKLSLSDIENLWNTGKFVGLSEMMDVPGVIYDDPDVVHKLELFRKNNLIIDGHAPGLRGMELSKYIRAGISTDHECSDLEEALEKIEVGMKILIREGSAAKNYESLKSLIALFPDKVMFCTDDSHPGDLLFQGHIDKIVKRAIHDGFDLFDVLKIASVNAIRHYGLNVGTLQINDPADFVVFRDMESFEALAVYIGGEERYNKRSSYRASVIEKDSQIRDILKVSASKFQRGCIDISEISKPVDKEIVCIKVLKDQILTPKVVFSLSAPTYNLESDIERDILKIVYLNRYTDSTIPQIAFITGIGLKKGAFASSISHDSHNIIAVGTNDRDLASAINVLIRDKGGLCVADHENIMTLALPIAGIMTDRPAGEVVLLWNELIRKLNEMGCVLDSPFMTLSFMALIVIPELKIGEKGLFEFSKFAFIDSIPL